MASAAVMAIAAAASMAGQAISSEQQRKQNRKARLLQEAQMMDTKFNQQQALGRSQLINMPVFNGGDVNRMKSAYTDSVYGGYNQGVRAIQDSLAARGLSKSGLTDEQMFDYNLKTAIANSQGINQILTQTATSNRGALENYVRMANSATLGYEPQLQQQTQNLGGLAMADPRIGLAKGIGNTSSQGLGWYAGQYDRDSRYNSMMGMLNAQQYNRNYQPIPVSGGGSGGMNQSGNINFADFLGNSGYKSTGLNNQPSGSFNRGVPSVPKGANQMVPFTF